MVKKNTPEDGAPKPKTKLLMMVSLASMAGAYLAALYLTLATFHISPLGLHFDIHSGGLIATGLLMVFSLFAILGLLKAGAVRDGVQSARIEALKGEIEAMLKENNAKFSASVSEIEQKIDQFLGENYARLEKENQKMRSELDEVQKSGLEDVSAEIATLRLENSNLQEMITQWAINSVDDKVKHQALEVA